MSPSKEKKWSSEWTKQSLVQPHWRKTRGVPVVAQQVTNPISIHEDAGLILGLSSVLRTWCCCGCGVGWQLQLWCDPLPWERPYAAGAALKKQNKTKQTNRKQKEKEKKNHSIFLCRISYFWHVNFYPFIFFIWMRYVYIFIHIFMYVYIYVCIYVKGLYWTFCFGTWLFYVTFWNSLHINRIFKWYYPFMDI